MRAIRYTEGAWKYQLAEDYHVATDIIGQAAEIPGYVQLDQGGVLHVRAGYCWDGASGPTIDTKSSMRASLVHDALYQLEREGRLSQTTRAAADELLERLCVEDGMWRWRARAWLWAVRRFAAGAAAYKPAAVLTAP